MHRACSSLWGIILLLLLLSLLLCQFHWGKEGKADECYFWEITLHTGLSGLPRIDPKGFLEQLDMNVIQRIMNFEKKNYIFIFTELSLKFSIFFYFKCGQQTVDYLAVTATLFKKWLTLYLNFLFKKKKSFITKLTGSYFPNQGLNPGHNSESIKS